MEDIRSIISTSVLKVEEMIRSTHSVQRICLHNTIPNERDETPVYEETNNDNTSDLSMKMESLEAVREKDKSRMNTLPQPKNFQFKSADGKRKAKQHLFTKKTKINLVPAL